MKPSKYSMKNQRKSLLRQFPSKPVVFLSLGFSIAFLFIIVGIAVAAEVLAKNPSPAPVLKVEERKPFEYVLENRSDPFMPFIAEKAATKEGDMNEIVDTNEELTGMQVFEPGQLSLVALLEKEGEKFAMVQDFTGKGYVITEGTKIGKRGVVKAISPNKVLIEETALTRAGKKIITHTDMVLKKEGEK